MNFDNTFKSLQTSVESRLKELIPNQEPRDMYEPFSYFMEEGGKRLRPILTMLACGAAGADPLDALDYGCSIEILHNFTLVHDDIMDKSDKRRGRPTVHKKWNEPIAILTGDVMIGVAYDIIPPHKRYYDILKAFNHGLIEVCEGQVYDMNFNERKDVTPDEYLLMINKKTAKLLETCVVIGALVADASSEEIESLRNYAINLGLAFQIQDDVLDMTADESKLGKKVGLDIQEGKKTLLVLKAKELARDVKDIELLDIYYDRNGLGEEYVPRFNEMFTRLGVYDYASSEVERLTNNAISSLDVLKDNEYKTFLNTFAEKLIKRNS